MIFLRLLFLLALAWALPIQLNARDDDVIITTTQNVGWAALFGAKTTAPAPAAATPVAATLATPATPTAANTPNANANTNTGSSAGSTGTKSGGVLSSILSLFGDSSDSSSGSTGNTGNTGTTSSTGSSSTPSSGSGSGSGWLSSILGLFGGSNSNSGSSGASGASGSSGSGSSGSSGNTGTGTSASSSSSESNGADSSASGDTPGFTGLVTVQGAGNGQSSGSSSDSTSSSSSSSGSDSGSGASDSDISSVAAYAELGAGISYSPYTKDGQCKSASQVAKDMALLKAYPLIRLYSVDCSGVKNVLASISSSQKLFLGVWDINALSSDLPSMAEQVASSSRGWSAVHSVSIGNEVVNAGTASASQVASAVQSARSWFKQNASSYSGYIVAVDTLAAMMADSSMCSTGDYIAVNCHPYFSGIEASTAGTWLKSQVQSLQSQCGNGKKILITESGWPTQGNTEGSAVPSVQNQLLAIKSIAKTMGDQVLMFTTYNDYWKSPGSWNVEQHWGIYGDPSS